VVNFTHRPPLSPGKTRYPFYRRLDRLQGQSGLVRKISPPPGFKPRSFHPLANRYTEYAVPALFICVHVQCIRKGGGSQGGGYDYYRFLGCDIKLSGFYRHFRKHIFHIFKVKSVTTRWTAIPVSGNLNTPAAAVDMPNTCHAIR
jgi:hypothetical protein